MQASQTRKGRPLPNRVWQKVNTPAFVYDEGEVHRLLGYADQIRHQTSCRALFALKPFSFASLLREMASRLDGFAVSSLFEAKLARQAMAGPHRRSAIGTSNDASEGYSTGKGTVHLTTPGLRPQDVPDIGALCDFIAFNSFGQRDLYQEELGRTASCGLRVNPQMSFVEDARYDPCRPQSKLGAPLEELARVAASQPRRLDGLEGLLVHSNCESTRFDQLQDTVRRLDTRLGDLLRRIRWVNLGGGYLFDDGADIETFCQAVDFLQAKYGVQVYIEPGAAFIQSAGYIVSTVLDVLDHEGQPVAVLDTTVNHMPEVFEYGYEPDVIGHTDDAPFGYILAGCTCLAGDLFGEYCFDQPLQVGDRVVFCNMGAYTLAKAHTFNGVNLPDIYAVTQEGDVELKRRFTYSDFAAKWGDNCASGPPNHASNPD